MTSRYAVPRRAMWLLALAIGLSAAVARAQDTASRAVQFKVQDATQRMEMIVNSSRILTLEKNIPRALVNNPDLVRVQPISAKQIQVSALKPGVTQINVWDADGDVYSVDVIVYGDARELEMLLASEFKHASLKVKPLSSSVMISGYVDRPEDVSRIIRMAEDYYPKVIDNIRVGGVQQVLLHVQAMEVSRTKLRAMGFDWVNINGNDFVIQSVANLITEVSQDPTTGVLEITRTGNDTFRFGVVDGSNAFFGFVEALRRNRMAKVLAEPTLVTLSGRAASFNSGGEFAYDVSQGLGAVATEFREFGTRVDFVPIVLGNGNIRLEVRPYISEIDYSLASASGVPGLRTRRVDTAVELKAGQTLALAGLIQTRVEAENQGLPILADLPWAGALFRRVEENVNEVELLIMVTPELADAMDPHEVPPCGPGEFTTSPNDVDLYFRGYMEVPKCCDGVGCHGCPSCQGGSSTMQGEPIPIQGASVTPPVRMHRGQVTGNAGVVSGPQGPAMTPVGHAGHPDVSAPAYNSFNPPNRDNTPPRAAAGSAAPSQNGPGLLGPSGYDNLN